MNRQNCSCSAENRLPCIVSSEIQHSRSVYPCNTAIRRGTLYPDMDKPLCGAAAPSGCAEPTQKQAIGFSAWEVRLYLGTHPNDANALQMYRELYVAIPEANYACAFVPCTANGWTWTEEPWPWECQTNGWRA